MGDFELEKKQTSDSKNAVSDSDHLLASNDDQEKTEGRSNIIMAIFNTLHSIVGIGVIGFPYVLKLSGFAFGIVLIGIVASLSAYTLVLLIICAELSQRDSYQGVMEAAFGKAGYVITTAIQFLYPLSASVAYLVAIGDNLTKAAMRFGNHTIRTSVLANRYFVVAVVTLVVLLPLSFYRHIAKLAKWAALGILAVLVMIILMAVRMPDMLQVVPEIDDQPSFEPIRISFWRAGAIISFAFISHHNGIIIYNSLEHRTVRNWTIVAVCSTSIAALIMGTFGILGYISVKEFAEGDIWQSYCYVDDIINGARLTFLVSLAMIFPIEMFVVRDVFQRAVRPKLEPEDWPLWQYLILTAALVLAGYGLSCTTDCLADVLEIFGAMAGFLLFVFPCVSYLKLREQPLKSLSSIFPIAVAVFGVVAVCTGLSLTIANMIGGRFCSHGNEMEYCGDFYDLTGIHRNVSVGLRGT